MASGPVYTPAPFDLPAPREAELDGTQAIADALEIKDVTGLEPGMYFMGVGLTPDPNAPTGSLWFVNGDPYIKTSKSWAKLETKK